jgi:filamentous hemagglutinin
MSLTLDGTTGISATGNIYGNNIIVTNTLTAGTFSPTNLSASGNITASFFIGNGSQLTGIDATQIQSGTSNVKVVSSGGNATIGIGGTGNVAVFATTGAFFTGVASASGNTIGGNILTAGIMSSTGNGIHGNVLTAGLISATSTITSAANVVGGNLTTGGLVSATGNVIGNYLLGNAALVTGLSASSISSGTSNVNVVSSGGNVTVGIGGTSNVWVAATTGIYVTGLQSVSGNITGGNISATNHTGTTVSVTGNVTGGNILTAGSISATGAIASASTGTFVGISAGSGNVSGGNITTTGLITATGNITGGNLLTGGLISATGAITGAALTGTSLTVTTGNITAGNLLISGAIVDSAQLDIQTSASNANIAFAPNGTGIVTVSTQVSAVGNVTGGNIRTAGLITATGAITTGGDLSLVGNIVDTGPLTIITSSNGNITLAPNGTGVVITNTDIRNGQANGVGNIGSSTGYFNTIFAKATSAQYADLAEMYSAGSHYEPGTVVIFGGSYEVEISTSSHANTVAGVISTNPSYIMNAGQTGPHVAAVALQGRVPTRVMGTVRKGDRMVTGDLPGVATVLDPSKYEPGCILGKALTTHEPSFDENGNEIVGTIEVVVGRI